MALILAGRLAANLQRIGAVVDEQLPAETCRKVLSDSHLYVPLVRKAMDSLAHGRAAQVLRSRGLAEFRGSGILPDRAATANPHAATLPQLELIVARRRSVRAIPGLQARYVDLPLPADSLRHATLDLGLGADTYVASPALVWLLTAARFGFGFGSTVAFALELCGSFALQDDPDAPCSYGLQPAATPYSLTRGIQSITEAAGSRRVVGLARCRAACPYVLANSASPMESAVATLLSLPVSRGGFGIGDLVLNDRIELTEEQQIISGRPYLSIDGHVAGQPLGYEYDSDEFHAGSRREDRDRARLIAAQSLGYRLLPLTRDIVYDERRFNAFGREFARLVGKSRRGESQGTQLRRSRLREDLGLPSSSFGSGGFEDLVPVDAYDLDL